MSCAFLIFLTAFSTWTRGTKHLQLEKTSIEPSTQFRSYRVLSPLPIKYLDTVMRTRGSTSQIITLVIDDLLRSHDMRYRRTINQRTATQTYDFPWKFINRKFFCYRSIFSGGVSSACHTYIPFPVLFFWKIICQLLLYEPFQVLETLPLFQPYQNYPVTCDRRSRGC